MSGLMVLEYAWNVRFEMRVIWPQFLKRAEATIFVIARYVGIAGQIHHVWFVNRMASGIVHRPSFCKALYSSHVVIVQCLLMSVQVLLMMRVHQMYDNDSYVSGILTVLSGVQFTGMVLSARIIPKVNPSPTCVVVSSHPGMVYFGVSTIIVHLSLLTMILWRYFKGNWPECLHSYLKITVRDSTCAVAAVTGTFLPLALTPLGFNQSQTTLNFNYQMILFSFWYAAGRLVLGKERARQEFQNNREATEVDLDNLEPLEDPEICPARLPDSNLRFVPADVSIVVDPELGVGTKDITDERYNYQVDDASSSCCITTITPVETDDGSEGTSLGSDPTRCIHTFEQSDLGSICTK